MFPVLQELAQLFPLPVLLDFLLQLFHPALERLLLRVRRRLGPARGLVLHGGQQRLQGSLFPLVILLTRDAQQLRALRRGQLAGAHLEDHLRPLSGFGIHLLRLCRNRWGLGNLVVELFQAAGQASRGRRALALLQQGL